MLYYTTSTAAEAEQPNPSLSLGGCRSSSQIPNGQIHNLFPKIVQKTIAENRKIIRMIIFSNPSSSPMSNITVWSEGGQYSIIKLDAIAPAIDAYGNSVFEKVATEEQIPYQASLEERSSLNPLVIESLEAGASVGFWVRKELDLTKLVELEIGQTSTLDEIEQILLQRSEISEDQVKLQIRWD